MKNILIILAAVFLSGDIARSQAPNREFKKFRTSINQYDTLKARKLIDKGLNIDARDIDGKTPLLYSLQQNNTYLAKFFVKAGANISLTDYKGNSCLHYAIENCTSDSISYFLLKKGADLHVSNSEGYTPLHFSILHKCPDMSFNFIDRGADFYLVTDLNENCLHLSIESGCDTLSYFLINHAIDTRQPDNRGNTPLLAAMDFQRFDIAKKLISSGADINAINNDSLTALYFAVINENAEITKMLLEKGANPRKRGSNERPLYIAASAENKELTEMVMAYDSVKPESCYGNDYCYMAGYLYYVGEIFDRNDSIRAENMKRSHEFYCMARKQYKKELNDVRASNTGKAVLDVLLIAGSAAGGNIYVPDTDYESERVEYLKTMILKCDNRIRELEEYCLPQMNVSVSCKKE